MDYQSEVRKNFFKKISEETKETTLESLDFELWWNFCINITMSGEGDGVVPPKRVHSMTIEEL